MGAPSRKQATWLGIVLGILAIAAIFVLALVANGLPDLPWRSGHAMLQLFLLLAVLGAFFGTIAILDGDCDVSLQNRPLLRTVLCGALGAAAVRLVQSWPTHQYNVEWVAVGFFLGAALGWLGWTWAKYIDF